MIEKLEKKYDAASFAKTIEEYVRFRDMDYVEAIMFFCESNNLEVEAVAAMVKRSEPIRQKLEAQARAARLIGRGSPPATLDAFTD